MQVLFLLLVSPAPYPMSSNVLCDALIAICAVLLRTNNSCQLRLTTEQEQSQTSQKILEDKFSHYEHSLGFNHSLLSRIVLNSSSYIIRCK